MPKNDVSKPSKTRKSKYYRKAKKKPTATSGVGSYIKSYQILNSTPAKVYYFKDNFTPSFSTMIGANLSVARVDNFKISDIDRYTSLVSMFRQYKVKTITFRFTLTSIETTDNAIQPTMYVRFNNDPDLLAGGLTEDYFERQQNVVKKLFSHQSPQGQTLVYTIKPSVMRALHLWNSPNYIPSPQWGQWCDFDPSATTSEIALYGLQFLIPSLPTGQQIECSAEMHYCCRDLK